MKNRFFRIGIFTGLFLIMALLMSSCKVSRSSLKKPLKEYGFDYLYARMIENQSHFDYLNGKFSMVYQKGSKSKIDLRGQLRIRKDSIIWISLSPALGIEAARLALTEDSVKYLNRLNKTYIMGKYELVDSLINSTVDYSIIESMIIGNDLTQYDVNKFKSSIDGGLYRITIQQRTKIKKFMKAGEIESKVLVQNIWLDPETFKIRRVELKELDDENKKLQVFYNEYRELDGMLLPSKIHIEIISDNRIDIDVSFGKTELNNPVNFPFRISKKYKRMF